jgi:hypothetical protein
MGKIILSSKEKFWLQIIVGMVSTIETMLFSLLPMTLWFFVINTNNIFAWIPLVILLSIISLVLRTSTALAGLWLGAVLTSMFVVYFYTIGNFFFFTSIYVSGAGSDLHTYLLFIGFCISIYFIARRI